MTTNIKNATVLGYILRNSITGKFYSKGSWDTSRKEAEVLTIDQIEQVGLVWNMDYAVPQAVYDDSQKPIKLYESSKETNYIYKGHSIKIERRKSGRYPHKVKTEVYTSIDYKTVHISGIREAKKYIDNL